MRVDWFVERALPYQQQGFYNLLSLIWFQSIFNIVYHVLIQTPLVDKIKFGSYNVSDHLKTMLDF